MADFSLFPVLHWANQYSPDKVAIQWEKGNSSFLSHLHTTLSWQNLAYLIEQTSTFLQQKGAGSSQSIAYVGQHRLIGLLCYLSVIGLGGRILMLNPALPSSQLQQILQEQQISILITDQHFADFCPDLTADRLPKPDFQSPATLTLTSGSSGRPKAVVHSIQNHLDNAEGICEFMSFGADNQWLLSLPLFHVSGQGIIWRWLLKGATLWINEDKSQFDQTLAKVSHASLVPTQLQRYLTQAVSPSSQHILLGGSAIPPDLIRQAQQRGLTPYAGYGMTEMASTICASKENAQTVGKPLKGRNVQIVGEEIWVNGAGLALGYWQAGKLKPLTNAQGWLATKDKGYWTKEGELVVEGRLDNMFISGGENIQPEQIEQVLFRSNLVQNVLVVPVLDREFGERPVAVVQFRQAFSPQAVESLQSFASQHLERFKQPIAYYSLTDYAPSEGIKISRQQLKLAIQTTREQQNGI